MAWPGCHGYQVLVLKRGWDGCACGQFIISSTANEHVPTKFMLQKGLNFFNVALQPIEIMMIMPCGGALAAAAGTSVCQASANDGACGYRQK